METKARLSTESKDARSVAASLQVDNIELSGLNVKTEAEKNRIVTEIQSKNLKTLVNTLDDIISCQIVAEKTIE